MARSIKKAVRRVREAAERLTIRQAGGIVFRVKRHEVEVLLVTARRNRDRWVLPKGSIKRGESASHAALREVCEEAGVRGKIIGPAGIVRAVRVNRIARVEYFLIAFRGVDVDAGEARRVEWLTIPAAAALLSDTSARRVLLRCEPVLHALARREIRRA